MATIVTEPGRGVTAETGGHCTDPPNVCTFGPTAVDRRRCGKPAVVWFIANGHVYAECEEHR